MRRNKKRGFSTALATAILSITAAGILSSQDYSAMFANNTTETQVKNVSILVDSLVKRIRHDGKKAWKILDVDRLPSDGSVWSKENANTHTCDSETTCQGIFNAATPVEFNISEIRTITTGAEASCSYYDSDPTGTWRANFGTRDSLQDLSLLPCNLFRVTSRGPMGLPLGQNILTMEAEDKGDYSEITAAEFEFPLHGIITPTNYSKTGPYLIAAIKKEFKDQPVSLSIKKLVGSNYDQYGLTPALFMDPSCSATDVCKLVISINVGLKGGMGGDGGGGGCDGCLEVDASNSMQGAITFKDEEGVDLIASSEITTLPLLVWDIDDSLNLTPEQSQNPTDNDWIKSGIIAKSETQLDFKVDGLIPLSLSSPTADTSIIIGANVEIRVSDAMITLEPLQVVSQVNDANKVTLKSNDYGLLLGGKSVIHAEITNTGAANEQIRVAIGNGALEITDGASASILTLGEKSAFGNIINGSGQYYKIGVVTGGSVNISGVLSTSTTQASIDLIFEQTKVSGMVRGNINTEVDLLLLASGDVYLFLAGGAEANLDFRAVKAASLDFTKTPGSLPSSVVNFRLNPDLNATIANSISNILRIHDDGILESDQQTLRIAKALGDFNEYPGDCAYSGNASDCPTKAVELVDFLTEVPNVERTIDLIKKYTPNKYIEYQSDWLPIQSTSDTSEHKYGSFVDIVYQKEGGIAYEMPDLPERIRVIIRANEDDCDIPDSLKDSEGNFYQEAHTAAPTDDDIQDTGSGAFFSYNKKGVQIYAPTQSTGSKSRYLFHTYDGWGNEARVFHCDYGHVQVRVYRPEIVTSRFVTGLVANNEINIVQMHTETIPLPKASSGHFKALPLEKGSYMLHTTWMRTNFGSSDEFQYQDDVYFDITTASSDVIINGEKSNWVLGEQANNDERRARSTTLNTIQVNVAGVINLALRTDTHQLDTNGESFFNGEVRLSLDRIGMK